MTFSSIIVRPLALALLLGASGFSRGAYADEAFEHPTVTAGGAQQGSSSWYATTRTYRVASQKPMAGLPSAAPIPAVRTQPDGVMHQDEYEHSLSYPPG